MPQPIIEELPDPAATERAGARLAAALAIVGARGRIITFEGELGAGKTTMIRGVLRELGWSGPVKSPTYALVEIYPISSLYCYHFDFYRVEHAEEWHTSGMREYFRADSLCLIEWPQKVAAMSPTPDVTVVLAYRDSGRVLTLSGQTVAGEACLDTFTKGAR